MWYCDVVVMLRRKAYDLLLEWKHRPGHKSLLVRGQRQVGKTYIIREFSKTYDYCIEVDLSVNSRMRQVFEESSNVDHIIQMMTLEDHRFKPVPGKTLIFLDEIQSCPSARSFLKQFTLDGRFDVIASGSLLDIPIFSDGSDKGTHLLPVGYEEHFRMFGLDFEEFLWAIGFSGEIIDTMKASLSERHPLPTALLDSLNAAFDEFMAVGGMPEAVKTFIDSRSYQYVKRVLDSIVMTCYNDIFKYSRDTDALKIRKCYDSIPIQLAESNKKFMYSRIGEEKSRSGARKYGDALLWIEGAGIGNMCYQLRGIDKPLGMSRDLDHFKVYMSDTGTLVRLMDGTNEDNTVLRSIMSKDTSFNNGALVENVVAECLMKSGIHCNYYINRKNPGRMELDFVVNLGSEIVAIEVKSGKDREAPSLSKTIGDARFQRRMKFERGNVYLDEDGIEHYPLFASAFMNDLSRKVDDVDSYFADNRSMYSQFTRESS